jgi:hypothetical protein
LEKIPPQTIFEPARTFETIGRIKLAQLVGNWIPQICLLLLDNLEAKWAWFERLAQRCSS